MEFKVLKGLKFIPNVRHPGVLWTKRHTNPLSFGANFVKKKLIVVSPANGLETKLNSHQYILIREINITYTTPNHHHHKPIQPK